MNAETFVHISRLTDLSFRSAWAGTALQFVLDDLTKMLASGKSAEALRSDIAFLRSGVEETIQRLEASAAARAKTFNTLALTRDAAADHDRRGQATSISVEAQDSDRCAQIAGTTCGLAAAPGSSPTLLPQVRP